MRRLTIAVDCDDVLAATTPFFINEYNKAYNTNVQLSQAHAMTEDVWGAPADEVITRIDAFMNTDAYKQLGPTAEEILVLKDLAQNHSLHLVTARKETERELTQAMLDRDLKDIFVSIDLVGWQGSKGEVCARIGADVLIDDSARHLHDAIKNGLSKDGAILFGGYAWNAADSDHEDLTTCSDWPEVKRVIDTLAEKA